MGKVLLAAAAVFLFCGVSAPAQSARTVEVLTLSAEIDPVTARYVTRGLARAKADGAALLVLELDTPGGLEVSMREIVQAILSSEIPVAVWVAPSGARAASAGTFIAMAAHVAAMAPGTHIGAAHPVGAGGQDIPGVMGDKVLADTEAYLQSLATLKGRSESWAEAAVRRSESLTETEALDRHVVDFVAPSLDELLRLSDGRSVRMAEGSRLLDLRGATVRSYPMGVLDRLLEVLVNPDLAYVLLVIGIFGIIFELAAPGIGGAGIAGAIAIMLALIGFGSLPTNLAGLLFILGAVLLFIIDLKAPTHGIWTLGGIVTFVLGSILLFPPWRPPALPPAPELRVSPLTISVATVLLAGFFVFALGSGIRAQARKVTAGEEALIGMRGNAVGDFAAGGTAGFVRVGGETWSATSVEGALSAGDAVEVVGRTGLTLSVRRVTAQGTSRATT